MKVLKINIISLEQFCAKLMLCMLFPLLIMSCGSEGEDKDTGLPVSTERYNISPCGKGLVFNASMDELADSVIDDLSYQWYRGKDSIFENAKSIRGATSATYNTGKIAKGIHYYFCVVTEPKKSAACATIVRPFTVAYTGLPLVEINTVEKEEPTAEFVSYKDYGGNYGRTLRNATKVPASMRIVSNTGEILYESGAYEKGKSGLKLKLRGNTSASSGDKKPYKITLQKKADLLKGICVSSKDKREASAYKDKDWLLLKEATTLNNFVGLSVADIAGTPWTPEFAFVDVVINGTYRGVYLLTESVKRSEKRINVEEDGWIIERDSYWWNEDVKIITDLYNQKYTFKYPKPGELQEEELLYMKNYLVEVERSVQNGTYDKYFDVESFARWLLIHDLLGTWDSGGSNQFFSKRDMTQGSLLEMSTPWDFDSNYEMEGDWSRFHNDNRGYMKLLFESSTTRFSDSYRAQWEKLSPTLWTELYARLKELKKTSGAAINISREYDALRWNTSYKTVETDIETAEHWFDQRMKWLKSAIL